MRARCLDAGQKGVANSYTPRPRETPQICPLLLSVVKYTANSLKREKQSERGQKQLEPRNTAPALLCYWIIDSVMLFSSS